MMAAYRCPRRVLVCAALAWLSVLGAAKLSLAREADEARPAVSGTRMPGANAANAMNKNARALPARPNAPPAAPARPNSAAQGSDGAQPERSSDAPAAPEQEHIDFERDEPPETAFDQLGQQGRPAFAKESFALIRQLGRTVLALLFTCALIYLFFRLGMPRLTGMWSGPNERTFSVRERLPLDGNNQLVRVEDETGQTYLFGVGAAGVALLEKWPAPPAGPLPGPRRARSQFAEALAGTPTGPTEPSERDTEQVSPEGGKAR